MNSSKLNIWGWFGFLGGLWVWLVGGFCGGFFCGFLFGWFLFWFGFLGFVFFFLKGAEAEPCELMYSVQMMTSVHFAGGLLMCAQGQACFAWLKNALSLPNTKSVETDKNFFACFSGLWLTHLLCKLKQPNKTQNLSVRISTCLFRSTVSLWSDSTSQCSSSQGDTHRAMLIFVDHH